MAIFRSKRTLPSTPLSDFFRNASSREKKKVYEEVLRGATERQQKVIAASQKKG